MKNSSLVAQERKFFKISQYIIAFLLIFGILLRFYNIEGKVYWRDEVFTSLQVSGNLLQVVNADELFTGKLVGAAEIAQYQHSDRSLRYADTVKGLKEFEPQLTPLFFLLLRGWNDLLGNSIFQTRLFSVLTSLLCLPIMYWLCLELFENGFVGFVTTAFLAVSPFQMLYAHEARPYSLWGLTTLLSCWLLLNAQKRSTWRNWSFYFLALTASLYTFLFAILTSLAHGIYIFLSEKDKLSRATLIYALSTAASLLAFSPWIGILVNDPPSNYAATPHENFLAYPKGWLRNLSLPFADFGLNDGSSEVALILFFIYLLLLLATVSYAYFYLKKNAAKNAVVFLLSLFIVPFFVLLIYDLGKGGQTTTRGSYLIPSILSIQITFGYLMASKMLQMKRFWMVVCIFFLGMSAISSVVLAHANTWWHKADENIHHHVAAIVNATDAPLIISDVEFSLPISLSHSLKPETKYILLPTPKQKQPQNLPAIPYKDFSKVFLYRPSEQLQNQVSQEAGVELINLIEQTENFCDCTPQVLVEVSTVDR